MSTAVFCIAANQQKAENIGNQLKSAGFALKRISVLFSDRRASKEFDQQHNTKTPESVTIGTGTGGLLGGAFGWIVGIGVLVVPGVGPLLAVGPIVTALSGIAVGAALGSIAGRLVGMGLPESDAKRIEDRIQVGRIAISVQADDAQEIARAKEIFRNAGAQDISSAITGDSDTGDGVALNARPS
jgi:uncharacterized membrane protein